MDEGTDQVELRGGGWNGPIGYMPALDMTNGLVLKERSVLVQWQRIDIPEFFLCPAAAILIAQGKPIQDFFPPDVGFFYQGASVSCGPYFFLKGRLTKPAQPPPRLMDVVLGRVDKCPEDMKMEELRGLLLERVM